MLKIGDFSRLSNTSVRMLRHYDEINLLKPVYVEPTTGYRYYTASQIDVISEISRYKELGIPLSVVKEILVSRNDISLLQKILSSHLNDLKTESDRLKKQIALVELAKQNINDDKTHVKYSVALKTLPERKVISLRKVIGRREDEGILWIELNEEILRQKISLSKDCLSLAVYHDEEYKDSQIDVEIQTTIEGEGINNENVAFKCTPEKEVVSVTFRGNYNQRPQVTKAIAAWLEISNYAIDGPMFNIFHITPYETSDSEEWLTEVCYSVRQNQ